MDAAKVYFFAHHREEESSSVRKKVCKILDESENLKKLYNLSSKGSNSRQLIAIKIHGGEEGNNGHVPFDYLTNLPDKLREIQFDPFLTDTNVLYHGSRMNSVDHLNIFRKHGFHRLNLPIIISDGLMGNDYIEVPVKGKHFKSVKVAKGIYETSSILGIAHLTGHMLTGFGGAIKNIGMGCASLAGKMEQHCRISPHIKYEQCKSCGRCFDICPVNAIREEQDKFIIDGDKCIGCAQCVNICNFNAIKIVWDEDSNQLQQRMVEYAYGVIKDKPAFFINFVSFITRDCDCLNKSQLKVARDLGILASFDPVALDKASIDLLNKQEDKDLFKELWPEIDHTIQLDYAQRIGLGKMKYELVKIK